uniref:Glutathione transferase n=1 Tax=Macrostomum lignano TaxID=282301 RepID=A0A1I8F2T9_9PLAT
AESQQQPPQSPPQPSCHSRSFSGSGAAQQSVKLLGRPIPVAVPEVPPQQPPPTPQRGGAAAATEAGDAGSVTPCASPSTTPRHQAARPPAYENAAALADSPALARLGAAASAMPFANEDCGTIRHKPASASIAAAVASPQFGRAALFQQHRQHQHQLHHQLQHLPASPAFARRVPASAAAAAAAAPPTPSRWVLQPPPPREDPAPNLDDICGMLSELQCDLDRELQDLFKFNEKTSTANFEYGDARPELPAGEDALVLFESKFCPFCQRVVLALNQRGIPYQSVYINLSAKPEWFAEINPGGKVPVLMMGSQRLVDSLMICRYVDELPSGGQCGCRARLALAWLGEFFPPMHDLMTRPDEAPEKLEQVTAAMRQFGERLGPKPFIGGAQTVGLADLIAYPAVAIATGLAGVLDCPEPAASDTALAGWLAEMQAVKATSAATKPVEWGAFLKSLRAGNPDYSV